MVSVISPAFRYKCGVVTCSMSRSQETVWTCETSEKVWNLSDCTIYMHICLLSAAISRNLCIKWLLLPTSVLIELSQHGFSGDGGHFLSSANLIKKNTSKGLTHTQQQARTEQISSHPTLRNQASQAVTSGRSALLKGREQNETSRHRPQRSGLEVFTGWCRNTHLSSVKN